MILKFGILEAENQAQNLLVWKNIQLGSFSYSWKQIKIVWTVGWKKIVGEEGRELG